MTCPSCSGPLVPALLSYGMRESVRIRLRTVEVTALQDEHESALRESSLLRLGLFDRCAECFWWRVALLLGYCAV